MFAVVRWQQTGWW